MVVTSIYLITHKIYDADGFTIAEEMYTLTSYDYPVLEESRYLYYKGKI